MSKKQASISRSSTEPKYRNLATTIAELTWLKSLLSELQVPFTQAPNVYCDNLSIVMIGFYTIGLSILNWIYILSGKMLLETWSLSVIFPLMNKLLIY